MSDSDSEMAKAVKDIPSAQPPTITVIPINFDMDSWDNEHDNEETKRRFQNDGLPVYAVLKDATFTPVFGSDEAKTFFNEKIKQFNTEMRRSYREFITTEAKIYVDSATEEIHKIWQETTKEIQSRNKDSSRTIVKLNERIRQLKEEWAKKYRRASNEPVRGNIFKHTQRSRISYCRPLSSSSSSYFGWLPFSSRRKKRHNYHLHHAGVVVTIDRYVEGKDKWLIHKGEDYGDASDTVITDADYMSSRWTNTKTMYPSCRYTVNSCMRAARNDFVYSVYGPNCQTAANGIWDLLRSC
ncbi:unnamed protein product [Mytilus edulis]|uniref:Uncharacterized protein n=1 Tax=Mytilus edulis TaxID=6550 RepID=A0A8S3SKQ6_MYTED|nr:unnamed protein product [Mytilus edulis]